MEIRIKTIPHKNQRYKTCGDYWDENNVKEIRVSDLGNKDMEFLVALHEIIESYLCEKRGIKEQDITKFDIEFEKNRKNGDTSEPGDDKNAPYRKEHFFATNIERIVCQELGIDWLEYEKKILELER